MAVSHRMLLILFWLVCILTLRYILVHHVGRIVLMLVIRFRAINSHLIIRLALLFRMRNHLKLSLLFHTIISREQLETTLQVWLIIIIRSKLLTLLVSISGVVTVFVLNQVSILHLMHRMSVATVCSSDSSIVLKMVLKFWWIMVSLWTTQRR